MMALPGVTKPATLSAADDCRPGRTVNVVHRCSPPWRIEPDTNKRQHASRNPAPTSAHLAPALNSGLRRLNFLSVPAMTVCLRSENQTGHPARKLLAVLINFF